MDSSNLISVIVPVYKVAQYLDRCVVSIIRQTYTRMEIILVDDGSPDECPVMCDNWASKDCRIHVVHKPNGGLSSARNAGIRHSHGAYIAFVDADDWIEPDYLETLYQLVTQHHADLALCSIYDYRHPEHMVKPLPNRTCSGHDFFVEALQQDDWHYIVAWNKLYARKLCPTNMFPEGKIHEDEFVFHLTALHADTVVTSSRPLYHYMVNESGIMHADYSIRNLDRLEATLNRLDYIVQHHDRDCYSHIVRQIRREFIVDSTNLPWHNAEVRHRLRDFAKRYNVYGNTIIPYLSGESARFTAAIGKRPMLAIYWLGLHRKTRMLIRRTAKKLLRR